ncbi:hypothetical protein GQ53DRAFT_855095 [Thozetella sp. PMI_491]|nr:hypothetical protein GQ53DRAFT_855095 [Thozetella sp. PMI_491]
MRSPPPDVILSWPPPSQNPVTRGPALLITELTIMPIALVCLLLRLYVRLFVLRRSGWDDWLMVASMVCGIGVTICVILASEFYGWDVHVWDLQYDQMGAGRRISIAGQTIFLFASGLAKSSILVSYLRIAPKRSTFRVLTWTTLAIVVAAIFVFLIVLWTQCSPASSYWTMYLAEQDCEPEGPPLMAQTITTVITDFIVFVLPLPTLYQLRLPMTQRLALIVLFGMGVVVVIASAMRAYWVHHVVEETYDVTWEGFDLWIWTAVEVNLGVIAGCIPVLKPLFYPATPSTQGTSYGRSNRKSQTIGLGTLTIKSTSAHDTTKTNRRTDDLESGAGSGGQGTFLRLYTPPSPGEKEESPEEHQTRIWSEGA